MKHLCITIKGRVQGVFFRASAFEVATQLGLAGFVRNRQDGSVYMEVEGEEEALNKLTNWCHHGPPRAVVEEVSVQDAPVRYFTSFEIQR